MGQALSHTIFYGRRHDTETWKVHFKALNLSLTRDLTGEIFFKPFDPQKNLRAIPFEILRGGRTEKNPGRPPTHFYFFADTPPYILFFPRTPPHTFYFFHDPPARFFIFWANTPPCILFFSRTPPHTF